MNSFGKLITEKAELKEAVASYVCRAAEKLRGDHSAVSAMQVFLLTNPFRNEPQTVDALNEKFGRNKIQFAAPGFEHEWKVRAEHRSQSFTTQWDEILSIKL